MGKRRAAYAGLSSFVSELSSASASSLPAHHPARIEVAQTSPHPPKKRKVEELRKGKDFCDATGLVPFYTNADEVPEHLQKYYSQRHRYFSLYDSGCLLDEEGWYSVTPERIADQIAERCRCDVILDAFCGVGGNAIAFAKTCERVIALDNSPTRLALARHNAAIYGVSDRIEFILTDYLSFAESYLASLPVGGNEANKTKRGKIDVVFLSPPWGGPSYLSGSVDASEVALFPDESLSSPHPDYSLSHIKPIPGADLFALTRKITRNVAFYLPRNTRLAEISSLVDGEVRVPPGGLEEERIEVEEEWMGSKLKALCCYFGGLVSGQEEWF
ncbi:hypothetical protein JAAARDRAFT_59975 [Jaapia argillacea MUCL 33604]|uniref:Trimethylguanosine synthase n=1 Tax=Jaapia argillacea MUCL 33604 TaxID=933084 RepID=A0A067PYR9_9AGAM|nr:hypothetical protein JAAARDRAFT_59975 [Jaapia argillacea MUCL 33604]